MAHIVWERFGNPKNYVEPFFGSGAVLLGRPEATDDMLRIETVNDLDGFVANCWRAMAHAPEEVFKCADQPAFENDLHARHTWLKARRMELTSHLEGDPDYFDAKIAGQWLWGMSQWIGSGFCGDAGSGPWIVEGGRLVKGDAGRGVSRQIPHLGNAGTGVAKNVGLMEWFDALSTRMKRVRVACGDWSRVMGPSVTTKHGMTGVFLDPPYDTGEAGYAVDTGCAADVLKWCEKNGNDPLLRIALCGYEGDHNKLTDLGWDVVEWKAQGGYGSQSDGEGRANSDKERIWFSPNCIKPNRGLFDL